MERGPVRLKRDIHSVERLSTVAEARTGSALRYFETASILFLFPRNVFVAVNQTRQIDRLGASYSNNSCKIDPLSSMHQRGVQPLGAHDYHLCHHMGF